MHVRRSCIVAPLAALIAVFAAEPALAAQYQDRVASATPVLWTPNVKDGVVNAIVPVLGGRLVAAGNFTQVKRGTAAAVARAKIFAYSSSNGAIDPTFAPNVVGGEIRSAVATADGSAVFIGGNFTSVNGVTTHIAKLLFPSGQLDPTFNVTLVGTAVNKLALANGKLYLAGAFKQVDGKNRSDLAAVDPVTGALDKGLALKISTPRQSAVGITTGLSVNNVVVSPDGHYGIVSGTFTNVGGLLRDQIAMVDLSANPVTVAPWSTSKFNHMCSRTYDTYVRGIDFSPDGSYFVIGNTGAWSGGPFDTSNDGSGLPTNQGTLCDSISRWEMNPTSTEDQQPSWVDYTGGDSITQVAATGSAVYAGGHARWINNPFGSDFPGGGGVVRTGIAALDPVNGMPLPWNPSRTRGKGVFAFLATSAGLWVGSDTASFANLDRERIAFVPLAGGEVVPHYQSAAVPAGNPANLDPASILASFRVTSAGVDKVYYASSDGNMYVAPYSSGTGYGPASVVNLYGMLTSCTGLPYFGGCQADGVTLGNSIIGFPVARVTSMRYDAADQRMLYTLSGDSRTFSKYFEADGDIVGTQGFIAP